MTTASRAGMVARLIARGTGDGNGIRPRPAAVYETLGRPAYTEPAPFPVEQPYTEPDGRGASATAIEATVDVTAPVVPTPAFMDPVEPPPPNATPQHISRQPVVAPPPVAVSNALAAAPRRAAQVAEPPSPSATPRRNAATPVVPVPPAPATRGQRRSGSFVPDDVPDDAPAPSARPAGETHAVRPHPGRAPAPSHPGTSLHRAPTPALVTTQPPAMLAVPARRPEPPVVEVSIGRLEIRTTDPEPVPARPARTPARDDAAELRAYLRGRARGGRR